MTFENFFTLTELKDGISIPTRVNDLVTVMQNQKENIVENVSEATRQWSAVANTIATTENKECLDLFIQLDGLGFIDKWLNDAQKLIDDSGNGVLEELVVALLRALERLEVDHHQSVDSGVGLTVQGLLGHSSLVVREKAKDLCDRWAPVQNIDGAPTDVNSVDISKENVEQPACSDTVQQEMDKEEIVTQEVIMESVTETVTQEVIMESVTETVTQEVIMESVTETIKVENDKSESESTPVMGTSGPLEDAKEKQKIDSLTTLSSPLEQATLTSSTDVDHGLESATKTETMVDKSDKDEEMVDGGVPHSPDPRTTTVELNTASGIGDFANGGGGVSQFPDHPTTTVEFNTASGIGDSANGGGGMSQSPDHRTTTVEFNTASGIGDSANGGGGVSQSTDHQTTTVEFNTANGIGDSANGGGGAYQSPDHRTTTVEFNAASGVGDSTSGGDGGLQESPGSENPKSSSNTESDDDEKKDTGNESDDDLGSHSPLSKPLVKSQNDDLISKRPSDMELDYGMVDPLELARQVAIEVELEVDSQEQSCSTSTNEKEHQSSAGLGNEVSSGPSPAPAPEPEPMNNSEILDNPALNPEKGFSGFDLNEEVSFDEIEMDSQVPLLTPAISVVSASRAAAAANGPPVAPLQFEGTLGWKGSAATSAFRRIPEGEKTFSSSSSHSNSNQRLTRFEFDLNVAEGSEDKVQDFLSRDKIGDPSRLQLDLNSLGDSDASIITLDWKRDARVAPLKQNRPQSPSVSSSVQPSFRNIDLNLNDHFSVPNNASSNNPFLGKLFNSNKRDESVISIFGTQVEVNRKDNIPPLQPNGRILEPSVDFNLGRPGSGLGLGSSMPYSNLPAYGYTHNGFTMGHMYGPPGAPIPYMVDSRGAPIIPPIQPIPPSFSQPTQPFFFNMGATGAPSGSNGAGPSRNTLDLNSGFITERGNRETNNGGLRQFFNHNQASSSSVIGGKRDQPDSGWDLFPINYKHQQPPWQ